MRYMKQLLPRAAQDSSPCPPALPPMKATSAASDSGRCCPPAATHCRSASRGPLRHSLSRQPCPVIPQLQCQVPPAAARSRRVTTAAAAVDASIQGSLYQLSQYLDQLVQAQLSGVTPVTFGVVFLAGLGTSLSPCTLSVLPLTIGYIGGYADTGNSSSSSPQQPPPAVAPAPDTSTSGGSKSSSSPPTTTESTATTATTTTTIPSSSSSTVKRPVNSSPQGLTWQALAFSLGLASTLAGLGVVSSLVGAAYGVVLGDSLPLLVGGTAVVMGLNLLEVVPLQLPSLDLDVRRWALPGPLKAYLAGATFALAASPCSTPVLASLLGWVSANRDPLTGGALLLVYSCGYVTPLLVAASATGAVRNVVGLRASTAWVTPASGVLLLAGGTYTLLTRLVPQV